MKISTRTLLAAALLVALPTSGAMACTISNWNGTNTAAAANTGGPAEGIARYSGVCGLAVDSGKYVVDNTPGTEGTYRARFYVLTKATGGTVTIFRAGSGDNGASPVIEVDYTGSAFNFRSNGAAVGSGVAGIQANKWYSIEMLYVSGGNFTASVWGAGGTAEVGNVSGAAGTGTVGSAVLGAVAGSTGAASLGFDAFESTRSETTAIGRLCRGDANNSNTISSADASAIITEYLGGALASGQPDANESGGVTAADASVVMNLFLNGVSCS